MQRRDGDRHRFLPLIGENYGPAVRRDQSARLERQSPAACYRLRGQTLGGTRVLGTILLIILVLLLLGALPTWPYSSGWGYYPSGGVGLLVIILIVLLVSGRI
jgi:hypothetical protein